MSVLSVFLFSSMSCRHRKGDEEKDDSDRLYYSTLNLIKLYSDSLKTASDSLTVQEMFTRFNAELDSLNFSVDPDTDLLLSEGENDTMFIELSSLRKLYENRLKVFGNVVDTETDSDITLTTDSVSTHEETQS